MTEHVMHAVSQQMFIGAAGQQVMDRTLHDLDQSHMSPDQKALLRDLLQSARNFYNHNAGAASILGTHGPGGFSVPYIVNAHSVAALANVAGIAYAHAFAGFGIQFLLLAAADLASGIVLERQRGLWKRLRSAPVSRATLLAAKSLSGMLICSMSLLASFAFAMVVFKVRIHGSLLGFFGVALATGLMASTFGVAVAALGRTPGGARGVAVLAAIMMVMLGGGWVPTLLFPSWLQRATIVVPARWAVDGLDAMTWRGLPPSAALLAVVVLLGFAFAFGAIALMRFRWEEA